MNQLGKDNKGNNPTDTNSNPFMKNPLKKLPRGIDNLFTEQVQQKPHKTNKFSNVKGKEDILVDKRKQLKNINLAQTESNTIKKGNNINKHESREIKKEEIKKEEIKKEEIKKEEIKKEENKKEEIKKEEIKKEEIKKEEIKIEENKKEEIKKEEIKKDEIKENEIKKEEIKEKIIEDKKELDIKNAFEDDDEEKEEENKEDEGKNKIPPYIEEDSDEIKDKNTQGNDGIKAMNSFDDSGDLDKFDNLGGGVEKRKSMEIPEVDEPVIPLTFQETQVLLSNPKFQKVKQMVKETEENFKKTVIEKQESKNLVKVLVSKEKSRFTYDGFDLDLTYITMNIIAMGFPATALEGIYRNSMSDVKKLLEKRHANHYKVYNLCEEKTYGDKCFFKQGYYPFKDHEAPPLNLLRPFCEDAKKFLDEDPKNIVAIHCKAGKGRTGTLIACLLLYMNIFDTAEEALLFYGLRRVGNPKGVTIPSQVRYVHYFESIYKNNIPHPIAFQSILLKQLKIYTIPKATKGKFTGTFSIENQKITYKYSKYSKNIISTTNLEDESLSFPLDKNMLPLCGDVLITFYYVGFMSKTKLFKFWFNTNFLPPKGLYTIKKEAIDKACKDAKCKIFKENFKVELEYQS